MVGMGPFFPREYRRVGQCSLRHVVMAITGRTHQISKGEIEKATATGKRLYVGNLAFPMYEVGSQAVPRGCFTTVPFLHGTGSKNTLHYKLERSLYQPWE